jgi:hypothetical protein
MRLCANTTPKHHHNTAISNLWVDFITKTSASDRAAVGPSNFYTAPMPIQRAWCVGGLVPFMINVTHLRIKPLPLTNSHGRYKTVTPERTLASVEELPLHA